MVPGVFFATGLIGIDFALHREPHHADEENNCASTNEKQVQKLEEILQKLLETSDKIVQDEDDLTSNEIENELRKMGYV